MSISSSRNKTFFSALILTAAATVCMARTQDIKPLYPPSTPPEREYYTVDYIDDTIVIDGILDEDIWQEIEWSRVFQDIEGLAEKKPSYLTKVKMCWNSEYLFIGALLEEEHIWAKLKERDSIIFFDNDFEIFLDPDKDSHNYIEIELNAHNTVWDLLLVRPYRDTGPITHGFDFKGLKTAVDINGTLNDPSDIDSSWSIEIAIPWNPLFETSGITTPPDHGDSWYINFSRVQWDTEIVDGQYLKLKDENGKNLSEHNWVWSPQGLINMHYPEFWGTIIFNKDNSNLKEILDKTVYENDIRRVLRAYYYAERNYYYDTKGDFTDNIDDLIPFLILDHNLYSDVISIHTTPSEFEIIFDDAKGKLWHIKTDGELWHSPR